MESHLIQVSISRNGQSLSEAKMVSFQEHESLRNILMIFSKVLKINAVRIFSSVGEEITKKEQIKSGLELVVSSGEQFAYARVPGRNSNGKDYNSRSVNKFHSYQIAVMGPAGVGKSCITNKFIRGVFISEYNNTLEDNQIYNYEYQGNLYVLDILDTAGEEDFISLRTKWLTQRQCFLFVYSVDKRQTYEDLIQFFELYIKLYPKKEKPIMLCGNKIDLGKREVSEKEGQQLAAKYGAIYFEVSAKEGYNVASAFNTLIDVLQLKNEVQKSNKSQNKIEEQGPLLSFCSFFTNLCS